LEDRSLELGLRVAENHVIYNHMVVVLSDDAADRIFQALGAATRRDILARAIRQEQSVSALARHYDMSLTAVQKHVAVLERAALVTKERRGREQIIGGDRSTLCKAVALLDAYEQLWIERATRIADILGEEGSTT
jgi:DNA-binding transcriptional ArsR family regulator